MKSHLQNYLIVFIQTPKIHFSIHRPKFFHLFNQQTQRYNYLFFFSKFFKILAYFLCYYYYWDYQPQVYKRMKHFFLFLQAARPLQNANQGLFVPDSNCLSNYYFYTRFKNFGRLLNLIFCCFCIQSEALLDDCYFQKETEIDSQSIPKNCYSMTFFHPFKLFFSPTELDCKEMNLPQNYSHYFYRLLISFLVIFKNLLFSILFILFKLLQNLKFNSHLIIFYLVILNYLTSLIIIIKNKLFKKNIFRAIKNIFFFIPKKYFSLVINLNNNFLYL